MRRRQDRWVQGLGRQPFPALRPPAFQHQPPTLGGHPRQESVGPLAAPNIRLERAFHGENPRRIVCIRHVPGKGQNNRFYRSPANLSNRLRWFEPPTGSCRGSLLRGLLPQRDPDRPTSLDRWAAARVGGPLCLAAPLPRWYSEPSPRSERPVRRLSLVWSSPRVFHTCGKRCGKTGTWGGPAAEGA